MNGFIEIKEHVPNVIINEYEELEIKNKDLKNNINTLWIKGSRRHFLKLNDNCYNIIFDFEKEESIIIFDFKSAWSIDVDYIKEVSKKYNIDFKIYAFECGMQFNVDIEIIKGNILKYAVIKYDDYIWECIDPIMGG